MTYYCMQCNIARLADRRGAIYVYTHAYRYMYIVQPSMGRTEIEQSLIHLPSITCYIFKCSQILFNVLMYMYMCYHD